MQIPRKLQLQVAQSKPEDLPVQVLSLAKMPLRHLCGIPRVCRAGTTACASLCLCQIQTPHRPVEVCLRHVMQGDGRVWWEGSLVAGSCVLAGRAERGRIRGKGWDYMTFKTPSKSMGSLRFSGCIYPIDILHFAFPAKKFLYAPIYSALESEQLWSFHVLKLHYSEVCSFPDAWKFCTLCCCRWRPLC